MNTQKNLKQAVPFFMVKKMELSLDFYTRGLGFELKLDWKPEGKIEWCWLERDGVALMLQEYRKERFWKILPSTPLLIIKLILVVILLVLITLINLSARKAKRRGRDPIKKIGTTGENDFNNWYSYRNYCC
jgi:hypothetical protein